MKKLFYLTSVIVAAVLAVSCEKTPQEDNSIRNSSFNFSLKVTEVGADYAKISVKHDGPEEATWYGFVAEDKKSANDLIIEKLTEFATTGTVKGIRTSKNRTVTVDGLESATTYKYIVFAVTENGENYPNVDPKVVTFTTGVNPYVLTQTDEWTITRLPERIDNKEIISIESKNQSPLYVWDYVSKEWVDNFNKTYPDGFDVQEEEDGPVLATLDAFQLYIIQQIATIQYYVASAGEAITNYTYAYDSANPENNVYEMPRISSGEYYFLAFGFNHDASHTQTYSVSDVIVVEEEAITPEYESWFGNYTFSGKSFWVFEDDAELGMKYGDERDVTYNISIEHLDNNYMYLIKGWECGEGELITDIETEFFELDKEAGDYIGFIGYYNDGKLEIRETSMFNDGAYVFGMYGYAADGENMSPALLEGTPMAEAQPIAEGETTTELVGLDLIYNGQKLSTYSMMGYIYYEYETYMPVAIPNMPVQFPITIEKAPVATAAFGLNTMKQDAIRKMKTAVPFSIEANKTVRPNIYSRR